MVGLVAGYWHDVGQYLRSYPGLPAFAVENPTGSAEGRLRALSTAIMEVEPDVVVGVNIADTYAACRRVRRNGSNFRTVMALHGISASLVADLRREAEGIDAVIATNRLTCRLCVDRAGKPSKTVFYAPYGVDTGFFGALQHAPSSETLRIVWVGRLDQGQKRVDTIPAIVNHLDALGIDYTLRIVGDGPKRPFLHQKLQSWVETGRVEILGMLSPHRIGPEVYADADVLLVTSSWETGPIVVWEAMASAVAVVSSRYVGIVLENALKHERNCLLFNVGDAREAAHQLARLRDVRLRETLVRGGLQLVEQRYSVEGSVRAWGQCLDSLMRLPQKDVSGDIGRPRPAGRLDRWLGVGIAESVRKYFGVGFRHQAAGGEWPHTAAFGEDEGALFEQARRLDSSR